MHRSRLTTVVLACLIAMAPASAAMAQGDFEDTAAFMDIGLGARAMGMGGAFVSVADDATCVYYNPAGLAIQNGKTVTSFYTNQLGAAGYLGLAYAQPRVGVGVLRLSAEDVQGTDEYGNPTEPHAMAETALLAAAAASYQGLHLGGAVKYYGQSLPDLSGSGFTCDIGALYRGDRVSVGLVGRNLLGSVSYSDGSRDRFDSVIVFGVSVNVTPGLTLALDYETNDTIHIGGEYALSQFALRGGTILRDGQSSLAAGLGFNSGSFRFNYAYQTHEVLDDMHRLSVDIVF